MNKLLNENVQIYGKKRKRKIRKKKEKEKLSLNQLIFPFLLIIVYLLLLKKEVKLLSPLQSKNLLKFNDLLPKSNKTNFNI